MGPLNKKSASLETMSSLVLDVAPDQEPMYHGGSGGPCIKSERVPLNTMGSLELDGAADQGPMAMRPRGKRGSRL